MFFNNIIPNNSKKEKDRIESKWKCFDKFPLYEIGNYGFLWIFDKQICEQEQIYPLVKLCISDPSISRSSLGLSAKFGKKCIQISQRFFKTIHKSELNCIQHIFKVAHLALKILLNSSENDLIMKYNILHTKHTSQAGKKKPLCNLSYLLEKNMTFWNLIQ